MVFGFGKKDDEEGGDNLNLASNAPTKTRVIDLNDFDSTVTLGTGTFGRVRLSKEKSTGTYYALKTLGKEKVIKLKQVEHVQNERQLLAQASGCPFIVNLSGHCQDEKNVYMLLEIVNGGELFTHLRKVGKFSNDAARFYAAGIILGFEHMQSMHIIYRDLKPENVLIDAKGYVKITDFGFAKIVEDRTYTLCGTPEYLAPEVIQSRGHGKAVDWWTLGILVFEMLAGYPPFYDNDTMKLYRKIITGKFQFPRHFDAPAKDLIKQLLQVDRSRRLGNLKNGAQDVRRHKWFRGFDWAAYASQTMKAPMVPNVSDASDTSNFDPYPDSDEDPNARPLGAEQQKLFVGF